MSNSPTITRVRDYTVPAHNWKRTNSTAPLLEYSSDFPFYWRNFMHFQSCFMKRALMPLWLATMRSRADCCLLLFPVCTNAGPEITIYQLPTTLQTKSTDSLNNPHVFQPKSRSGARKAKSNGTERSETNFDSSITAWAAKCQPHSSDGPSSEGGWRGHDLRDPRWKHGRTGPISRTRLRSSLGHLELGASLPRLWHFPIPLHTYRECGAPAKQKQIISRCSRYRGSARRNTNLNIISIFSWFPSDREPSM